MKRILSIDGGGIRGLIPAVQLALLEERMDKPVHQLFDMVAGTSAGGINALALTGPKWYWAHQLVDFYTEWGPKIFSRSLARTLLSGNQLLKSKYDGTELDKALYAYFGDTRLSECSLPVLVPSFEMITYSPYFFKSHVAWTDPSSDFLLRDVARASSSAQSYFPPHKVDQYVFTDGGVFANNPAACALAEAVKLWPNEHYFILSLGTGRSTPKFPSISDWGLVRWAEPLINILLDAVVDVIDYQMDKVLGTDFMRIQPVIPQVMAKIDRTEATYLEGIAAYARGVMDTAALDAIAERLLDAPSGPSK
jgi:patatin-like phospholipase/acyl hydrolase